VAIASPEPKGGDVMTPLVTTPAPTVAPVARKSRRLLLATSGSVGDELVPFPPPKALVADGRKAAAMRPRAAEILIIGGLTNTK